MSVTKTLTTTLATEVKKGDTLAYMHPLGGKDGEAHYQSLTYTVTHITRMGYGPNQKVALYAEPDFWTCGVRLGRVFTLLLTDTVEVQTLSEQ